MPNYRDLIEKLLKISQNIYLLNKLKTFDSSCFHGKNYFDEDGNQNYYIFQPISKYLKVAYVNDINYILSWKSRGLNDVKIESIKTNNY